MVIKQYDTVLLKDGTTACIVEMFSESDFLADVGDSEDDWDTISISTQDIEKVINN